MLRAVLLDVDGTLVDSNDAHAHAWADALAESGRHVTFATIRPLVGMGGDQLLPRVAGLSDESPEGRQLSERRARIFRERYLPGIHPFPRVRDLLLRIDRDGRRLVVASSAKEEELDRLLAIAGVRDLIDGTTSSDDAERSKPAPDIVSAALQVARCDAGEAILVGDTPYDIAAARRARVRVIALRCGGWHDRDLVGAAAVFADPADLLAHYDASPLAAS